MSEKRQLFIKLRKIIGLTVGGPGLFIYFVYTSVLLFLHLTPAGPPKFVLISRHSDSVLLLITRPTPSAKKVPWVYNLQYTQLLTATVTDSI